MAGKSSKSGNWSSSPTTRYRVSGKNREYYTAENAPGLNPYATGGTVVDAGDGYVYHIFVSDGNFTVTSPPTLIDSVQYMIVAGGGSAGSAGGGGGGGGFVFGSSTVSNTPGVYPIVIGAAGATTPGAATVRTGSPSTAFGLTAYGGGGGAASPGPTSGDNGGSGGGGLASPTVAGSGGFGNYPGLTIPRQGYAGGTGAAPAGAASGGGAGGFGGQGGVANGPALAIGPGRIAPEFPSTVIRQGIPAPVLPAWEPLVGPAGYAAGGYGTGSPAPLIARTNPANSGYGGNGPPGAAGGGSGIVCVRYVKSSLARATGGTIEPNTDPNHPGVWRHIFTSPGTFTVTDPTLQWIDYLAVGGGGAGGGTPPFITPPLGGQIGGGGGAGGFATSIESPDTSAYDPSESHAWNSGYSVRTGEQMPVTPGPYPITIGAGGPPPAASGGNTTIGSPGPTQIIAYGGGGGRTAGTTPSPLAGGTPGGSGGGGAKPAVPGSSPGGSATPAGPITFTGTQGNSGSPSPFPAVSASGGGGGAGASGGSTAGGVGWYSVISPPAYGTPGPVAGRRYFAGGGGAGGGSGAGGAGGGGAGAPLSPRTGVTNTGGGGGGGSPGLPNASGAGGPGIVIIQYPE